jgi:hypothetical protein
MRRKSLFFALFFVSILICTVRQATAQENGGDRLQIVAPSSGSAVQGNVQILINTDLEDTRGGELAFTYSGEEVDTWFLIWESDQPIAAGELAVWDTTTLTDGNYDLRLLVQVPDGEQLTESRNIRVRNYSAIETSTPAPTPVQSNTATPPPSPLPAVLPINTATPVPLPAANPASLNFTQVIRILLYSAGGVFGIFLIIGAYLLIRSLLRSRS